MIMTSSLGSSSAFSMFGFFQVFVNVALKFLTPRFKFWQFIDLVSPVVSDVLQYGNSAFCPLHRFLLFLGKRRQFT